MSDTPETDALREAIDNGAAVEAEMASLARKLEQERDEARNKMADALQEVDLRTLDFERMNQECYGLRKELEEYRSIAENIGALKAVSEKEKAIRERDEAREVLREIAEASGFDNIGNWARNKAKSAIYR